MSRGSSSRNQSDPSVHPDEHRHLHRFTDRGQDHIGPATITVDLDIGEATGRDRKDKRTRRCHTGGVHHSHHDRGEFEPGGRDPDDETRML